jgi:hypothetical protein
LLYLLQFKCALVKQLEELMTLTEKIMQHAKDLPESLQAEILDFVEYLESRVEKGEDKGRAKDWAMFSLTSAMRGMEEELAPYTIDDLKERFIH